MISRFLTRALCLLAAVGVFLLWRSPSSRPALREREALPPGVSAGHEALASAVSQPALPAIPDTFADQLAAFRAKLGLSASPDDIMRALTELAASQPALAIDLAHALGQTEEEKSLWVADLAKRWADRDPQQAWDWLSAQEQTRIRDLATGTLPEVIVGALAKAHPDLLLRNLDTLVHAGETPLGVPPVVAVHLALEALAVNNRLELARTTVERWATDPRQPIIGEAAYITVASALARAEPDAAGAWLKSTPASEARNIALIEFPAQWAQQQPRAALEWAAANLPADLRTPALQRAFSDWVEARPADAGEWLGSYLARTPPSAETDRLIATLINLAHPIKTNPATALQWTNLAIDPVTRATLEERVAQRWAHVDRSAALAFVASTPTLSPARKQSLIARLSQPAQRDLED